MRKKIKSLAGKLRDLGLYKESKDALYLVDNKVALGSFKSLAEEFLSVVDISSLNDDVCQILESLKVPFSRISLSDEGNILRVELEIIPEVKNIRDLFAVGDSEAISKLLKERESMITDSDLVRKINISFVRKINYIYSEELKDIKEKLNSNEFYCFDTMYANNLEDICNTFPAYFEVGIVVCKSTGIS